jgi:hypothetical protein
MNRMQLIKAHVLLAAFILPIALMFVITGALYTWDVKGSYNNNTYDIQLDTPLKQDAGGLTDLVKLELQKLNTSPPEGKPQLKVHGEHFLLEWSGSSKDVILEPTKNELVASLKVKQTTWYRNLVQLHKAKGGVAFKIYAVIFSIALIFLLISGFLMAFQTPQLKKMALTMSLVGITSFIIFVFIS